MQTEQTEQTAQVLQANFSSQQVQSGIPIESASAQTKDPGLASLISQSVAELQRKNDRSARTESSVVPEGLKVPEGAVSVGQERGVNASVAPVVLPVVVEASDKQAVLLPMPLLQKQESVLVNSAATGAASESQEASVIRDRVNDLHLLGAAHQPTLAKPASAVQVQMPAGMTPVHPGWQQAMSERVMWAANQQVQSATIQLDPPELGSLQVKLHIFQDQVSVTFTSPHANVRDAVEQSMPRLREMMAEQGLNLGESSVNDQSSEQGRQQREMFSGNGYGSTPEANAEIAEKSRVGLSLVDYYA